MTSTFYERVGARIARDFRNLSRYAGAKRGGLFIETNHDYKKTVLVAGSGRGGTTWLAEIINADNSFRDIFEPFHPLRTRLVSHFKNRQYLRAGDLNPIYLDPAKLILSGRISSDWTNQYNRLFVCNRRLVKDIRVNLLLHWVKARFPEIPIVLILRHPCAVAVSRLSVQRPTNAELEDILSQDILVQDHLRGVMPELPNLATDFERQIFIWCVENAVPLRMLRRQEALVVFYEHLCIRPTVEITRLCDFLNLNSQSSMQRRLTRPSSQTRKRASAIILGNDLVTAWKKHVSDDLVRRATEILEMFDLSWLYGSDGLPRADDDVLKPVA